MLFPLLRKQGGREKQANYEIVTLEACWFADLFAFDLVLDQKRKSLSMVYCKLNAQKKLPLRWWIYLFSRSWRFSLTVLSHNRFLMAIRLPKEDGRKEEWIRDWYWTLITKNTHRSRNWCLLLQTAAAAGAQSQPWKTKINTYFLSSIRWRDSDSRLGRRASDEWVIKK